MDEEYVFWDVNDSINEIFKPFWHNDSINKIFMQFSSNDTISIVSNHITDEILWYEKMDLSTKIALISLVVSVVIFFLGFLISEAIRRRNKSNELKQYKQFIQEWVYKSDASLNEYIHSLEDFSEKVRNNNDLNIAQWITSLIHLSEINKIPLEKFSDIYIWGHSKKDININRKNIMDFIYQIEYLNKVEPIIKEIYDQYCINSNKLMDEWNSNYIQLVDFVMTYNDEKKTAYEISLFEFIKLKLEDLQNVDGNFCGLDKWENEFINPLINLLDLNSTKTSLVKQIIVYVRNMKVIKLKHDKLNSYHEVFDRYIGNLKKAQSIINSSIEYFKVQNIKYFCK